jgi:hypothetical protein
MFTECDAANSSDDDLAVAGLPQQSHREPAGDGLL